MANFVGLQTINGLGVFPIFTAPTAGIYFVNGQLTLPSIPQGSGASQVICVVKNGASTIYTGAAGATGFQVNQIVCAAGDAITVTLTSSAAPDQVLNAVRGVVGCGNTF